MESHRPPFEELGITGEEQFDYKSLEPRVIAVVKREDHMPRIVFQRGQIDERRDVYE